MILKRVMLGFRVTPLFSGGRIQSAIKCYGYYCVLFCYLSLYNFQLSAIFFQDTFFFLKKLFLVKAHINPITKISNKF